MKLPFSSDQLKDLLSSDAAFVNILNSLPAQYRDQLKDVMTNQATLAALVNALPEPYRNQVTEIFTDIVTIPEKAMRLYKQCRYFEAREMLLKTIELYTSPHGLRFQPLDSLVEFAAKRVRALCSELLGEVEWELGNSAKAGQYHRQALELAEETGDVDTTVKALQGIGTHHRDLGDLSTGLEYCHRALDIITGQADRWRIRKKILTTLSVLYSDIGQNNMAVEYALEAVDLCSAQKDNKALPVCLNNVACLHIENEEIKQAIEMLKKGLEICKQENDLRHKALILNNLAMCHLRRSLSGDDLGMAASCINQALSISREIESVPLEALSMSNQGILNQLSEHDDEAREAFVKAVKIYRKLHSKSGEAKALANLGCHLKDRMADIQGAYQACREAIDIIEGIRGSLKSETHRIGYSDREAEPYEMIVDCLLQLKRPEEALAYVERAKSRALLDFLSGRLTEIEHNQFDSQTHHKCTALLNQIAEIRKNLEAIYKKQETDDAQEEDITTRQGHEYLCQSLMDELSEKEHDFEKAFLQIENEDIENASLVKVMPISMTKIQRLASEETLFVEFYQTEENLQMFIVTRDGPVRVVTIDLSRYEAMESVWNLMTGLRQKTALDVRSHEFIREIRQPLARFFDLLIAPLKDFASKYRRLIIAPHLFWHYLPFHALYDKKEKTFLCDQFEIAYSPSASILDLCQRKNRFGRDCALILSRNNGDLPHVDQEADLVSRAFSPDSRVFKGDQAYLGQIRKKEVKQDVIHLACHGQFNQEAPFLSGIDMQRMLLSVVKTDSYAVMENVGFLG
jgi:CHAT domain-containing protein